jgi:hypothetical protein
VYCVGHHDFIVRADFHVVSCVSHVASGSDCMVLSLTTDAERDSVSLYCAVSLTVIVSCGFTDSNRLVL